jgi:hypothetical protein
MSESSCSCIWYSTNCLYVLWEIKELGWYIHWRSLSRTVGSCKKVFLWEILLGKPCFLSYFYLYLLKTQSFTSSLFQGCPVYSSRPSQGEGIFGTWLCSYLMFEQPGFKSIERISYESPQLQNFFYVQLMSPLTSRKSNVNKNLRSVLERPLVKRLPES